MRSPASLVIATFMLAGSAGALPAQGVPPIQLSKLPHLAIISPVFFWDGNVDVVRTVSATCPNGRPIAGGVSIQKGNAALHIRESYPDGASWVMRIVNQRSPAAAQPLQVRAFAVCMLPVARGGSVQIAQYPRLLQASHRFALAPGDVSTAERQPCAQNTLVVSGGFGLDPKFSGASFVRMELSYPDKSAWNVRAVNGADAAQSPADVRVHGICLGTEDGVSIRDYQSIYFVEATVRVKPGDGAVRQSVGCGSASAHAIGGGARLMRGKKNVSIEMQESFPDTPGSWLVAVTNRSPGDFGDATVKLYAVCIKP
jgi:hypothetical protein